MKIENLYLLPILGLSLLLNACYPHHVDYRWGWTTEKIEGVMFSSDGNPLPQNSFIVIREYYAQFVQFEGESPLYVPQARIVYPDKKGAFKINFDYRASKIDLTFVASGYLIQQFFFQRQMGVGTLQYQASMEKTQGWQDHLFITLSPLLQQFILDQRFQMPDTDQLFVAEWLEQEKLKAEPKKNQGKEVE
ncbi:hypothetical protein WDW89_01320 [Deltaproteobacteria bacterium TL4]